MNNYECKKHKRYNVIRKPQDNCWTCWMMWLDTYPDAQIVASDLLKLALSLDETMKEILG